MMRLCAIAALGAGLASQGLGCANFFETRAISAFAESLEEKDVEALKGQTSSKFRETVLRRDDAFDALKQLNLPTGKPKVVKVVDEEDGEKKLVTVEIGEQKRKLQFEMRRDEETHKWVVDDIRIKRRLKPGQVQKTVTEQMDLLLSVRDVLDAWEAGDREGVLASTTENFNAALQDLPGPCLARLTKDVVSDLKTQKGLRPQVEGHKETAIVKLARPGGDVIFTLKQQNASWKVDDVAVQARREGAEVPSLRRYAAVAKAAVKFDAAYRAGDRAGLERWSVEPFYRLTLAETDLASVPLPDLSLQDGEFSIKLQHPHAVLMAERGDDTVQIKLIQEGVDPLAEKPTTANDAAVAYRVEEVTLFEAGTGQEKRLTALVSATGYMRVFADALAQRDLKTLQMTGSADFNQRVWMRLDPQSIAGFAIPAVEMSPPVVSDVSYKGPVTEIHVTQGQTPLTYILREQGSTLAIDNILYPSLDGPGDLKSVLELLIPIRQLSRGIAERKLETIKEASGRDFNRAVWNQVEAVPPVPPETLKLLASPFGQLQRTADRAIVVLGNDQRGAKIFLVQEGDKYVVDDILLIEGVEQAQRKALRNLLRQQLAARGPNLPPVIQ